MGKGVRYEKTLARKIPYHPCFHTFPLLQGPAPLEGWRYSHIVSGIEVPSHIYSEFAFSAIVISSEAEKSLSVFIFLACFLQGNADPTTAKKHMRLTAHVLLIITD